VYVSISKVECKQEVYKKPAILALGNLRAQNACIHKDMSTARKIKICKFKAA
jgi:hypothetical protein